ncbi:MAG: hypothetical protein ACLRIL_05155 [Fusicatenibacter saccharivorans]
MHRFQRVFRFLGYARENLDSYLAKDGIVLEGGYIRNTGDRSEQADASPLEIHFEENFSSVYGMNALRYLTREYGICDENGRNYFLDYFVRTKDQKYAIEENGLDYHHPQIIGEGKISQSAQETKYVCPVGDQVISIFQRGLRVHQSDRG